MKNTWLFVIVGSLFLANSVDSGASLVRSMGLRGSQQSIPEDNNNNNNNLRGQQSQSRISYQETSVFNGPRNSKKDAMPEKIKKGLGISAWGIIAIILGTIVLTTTGYYSFILYPFICKKQESYDIIELRNIV